MKLRSVLIAGVAAAAMPFAGLGEDITLDSPTVGWMKVKPTSEYTVIAVPWLGVDGEAVKVKDLVRTDTLSQGDALYVYDKDSKKYLSWTLNAQNEWVAATTVGEGGTVAANNASDAGIDMGKALFIKAAKSGEAYPDIYLYGKLATEGTATSVTIEGGSAEQGVHNLVASPKHEAFNPNGENAITGANAKDVIILPGAENREVGTLTRNASGKWGYYSTVSQTGGNLRFPIDTQNFTQVDSIPMGTGFWYVSFGSGTTINW